MQLQDPHLLRSHTIKQQNKTTKNVHCTLYNQAVKKGKLECNTTAS